MEKYKWLDIKSEEELKKGFKFGEICKAVLYDLGLVGVISIKRFSSLFKVIEALSTFRTECFKNSDSFFISEEHRIAFMLLHYNKQFNDVLGITQRHYVDKETAKDWRNKYVKMFHTDYGIKFPQQEEIVSAINMIYKRMVGEA